MKTNATVCYPGTNYDLWGPRLMKLWSPLRRSHLLTRQHPSLTVWETFFFSCLAILASCFTIVLAKLELHLPSLASG